jgi:hypothetical protein
MSRCQLTRSKNRRNRPGQRIQLLGRLKTGTADEGKASHDVVVELPVLAPVVRVVRGQNKAVPVVRGTEVQVTGEFPEGPR